MAQATGHGQGTGGGSATQAGINFQNRVAAWVATRILCDTARGPIFGLRAIPRFLRCETEQPVDDLLVGSAANQFAFAQVKHSIDLSDSPTSLLAEVVDQFARQIMAKRDDASPSRPWDRKPAPKSDTLVLIVGPTSSGQIREHLRNVLTKVRGLLPQQPLSDAASNAQETRALKIISEHYARSYRSEVGETPSDADLRIALSLMRVEVLDVDPGGSGEREAQDALRQIVLRNSGQAEAAWSTLVDACARMAETHSGADQSGLQKILLEAGFALNVPPSFRADIEQLRRATEKTEDILSDVAKIKVAESVVSINRMVTQEIQRLAETSHTLVVGEPGAGKSGALAHFVERLKNQGRDFVALAVDRLDAASETQLQSELRLEHSLDEVLQNWPGREPAFLVIDALDAARGGSAARTIRDLIARVSRHKNRWRVIASIRKFDLRYSDELRDLFTANDGITADPRYQDNQFSTVSHVNVSQLSDEELADVHTQSPALSALMSRAPTELQKLLRIPFNLRLLGELLGAGVSLDQLTPLRTQLDLLDKYWRRRVIGEDNLGYAREEILRRACEGMTASRLLRADTPRVTDTAGSAALHNLLSSHVLTEWQPTPEQSPNRYVIAFSHHVLFDYAAARLLLRGNPAALVQRVEEEPELCLFLRPSFVFHFQHLWNDESVASFWDFVFQLVRSPNVPEIGKLIGPSAAVNLVRTVADFDPLLLKRNSSDEPSRRLGEEVLQHVVGAVLVASRDTQPLVGALAGPWAELAERVSRNLYISSAYTLRSLLMTVCEAPGGSSPEQIVALGAASRRLLEFAWSTPRRDEWLVKQSIQCVCRTFDSDPEGSAALIRRALGREHLSQYGFEEMPSLARETGSLIERDPALVEDIYLATFQFREESDAPTVMSPSRILGFSGNRRQDYGMARFQLAAAFPRYMAAFPERGTRVAIAAVEGYVQEEQSQAPDTESESFDFNGKTARILADHSSVWDGQLSTQHVDSIKILDVFMKHCETLADEGRLDKFRRILDTVIEHNRLAVFWRRLLALAVKYPAAVGPELAPLAKAIPVLTALDTVQPVGEYLSVCLPVLPAEDRESIERTILKLPEGADA